MFLLLLLVSLTLTSCLTLQHPKCCASDSVLQKNNDSAYSCVLDSTKRIQISTNQTDFLKHNETGLCLDVSDKKIKLFESNSDILRELIELDVDFMGKCCPLNFFYDPSTHGCLKADSQLNFGESFVRVGLPGCRVIVDDDYLEGKRYCVDETRDNVRIVRSCLDDFKVCEKKMCVRKCCPDGQSFVKKIGKAKCLDTYEFGLDFSYFKDQVESINDSFVMIHEEAVSQIYPLTQVYDFYLNSKGIFTMSEIDETVGKVAVLKHYNIEDKAYCVEHVTRGNLTTYYFFRDYPKQGQIKFLYTGIAMSISCICLFLTVSYYCISNEKKTLFGKILICYSLTALIDFMILCYFAFDGLNPQHVTLCATFAFLILYLTLSVITWTNVMCIDIYCTFGSAKSFSSRQHKRKDWKRFIWYCLHGWGTPMILTLIPLGFHYIPILPYVLQTVIDNKKCVLYRGDGNYSVFLFSTIPFAILQFTNFILFIKTATYCWSVKKEINRMNDSHSYHGEKKQKMKKFTDQYGLILRLFFIMGIMFLFEVVSTFYDFKQNTVTAIIELVLDTFTCLHGLFIFLIFIGKKKNVDKLKKGLGLKKLRKISLMSSVVTQTTSLPGLDK